MLDQFSRTELLLGREGMERLARAHVAVFGLGGVGGYTAEALVRSGVGRVVVSLGEEGLLYVDREQELYQPAKRVAAVNTVGCGDTVTASFCMSLLAGEAADISLRKASALAAVNAVRGGNGNISMEAYLELL